MVRPKERYRHGARRRGSGELIPVFVIGPLSSATSTSATQTLVRGNEPSDAPISINVYQDAQRQLAPTGSKGFLSWLIAAVSDVPSSIDTVFTAQSESISEQSGYSVVSRHVINNMAYVLCLRSHIVTHSASVTFQYFSFQGLNGQEYGPVSGVQTVSRSLVLDAIYDLAVFSVNLDSGAVAASAEPFYQYSATVTGTANTYRPIYSLTEVKTPVPVAIAGRLPNQHPFKSCGPALWSVTPVGGTTTTTTNNLTSALANGSLPLLASFVDEVSRRFNSLLGFNSSSNRRVLQRSGVLELSDFQAAASSGCNLYQDLELAWPNSFAAYSPAAVVDREEVFADLSGLPAADQALFLAPSGQPPAAVSIGATSTAGTTTSATYFMGSTPTNQFSFLGGSWEYELRYWIPD